MEINFFPRWLLLKVGVSPEAQPHLSLFLSALITLLMAPFLVRVPHLCLMHTLLGVPCPGCGILHGMAALSQRNIAGAWSANPASLLVAASLALQLVARPIAVWSTETRGPITRVSACTSRVVLATLLLVWIHRLVAGGIHGCRLLS